MRPAQAVGTPGASGGQEVRKGFHQMWGCILGGIAAWVFLIILSLLVPTPNGWWSASLVVGAVLAIPFLLPMGRRLSVFWRWFAVSTGLVYALVLAAALGVVAVCSGFRMN